MTAHYGKDVGNPCSFWWKYILVQPLWKSMWRFLKKLKINLTQDPAIQLMGLYTKDCTSYYRDTCSSMFIAVLYIIARNWKQPSYTSFEDKWII